MTSESNFTIDESGVAHIKPTFRGEFETDPIGKVLDLTIEFAKLNQELRFEFYEMKKEMDKLKRRIEHVEQLFKELEHRDALIKEIGADQ